MASNVGSVAEYTPSDNAIRKRMELFHYEYQNEQREYAKRKELEKDAMLVATLKYTRDTFTPLGFKKQRFFKSVNVYATL